METAWQFIQQISSNPLWTLGSFIVAFISIILVVILHKRGQRTKKPTFLIRSSNLVSDFSSKLNKLQILYSSKEIENLTVSKIAFWNDGAQTIDSRDVAEADPLRIVLKEEYNILDISIIYAKNEANRFDVLPFEEGNSIKITFDYLDKDEGGVIQIIHTGKISSDIEIAGIVKGVGKPRRRYSRLPILPIYEMTDRLFGIPKPGRGRLLRGRRILGISAFGAAMLMIFLAVTIKELAITISVLYAAAVYGLMGYIFFKRRIPRGFEIVVEEI